MPEFPGFIFPCFPGVPGIPGFPIIFQDSRGSGLPRFPNYIFFTSKLPGFPAFPRFLGFPCISGMSGIRLADPAAQEIPAGLQYRLQELAQNQCAGRVASAFPG